jgi:NTP pyrophosphatase (non-canonical NTP hydrolase)
MSESTLNKLTRLAVAFRDEREWKQFHNPKDVALSMSLEVAELVEIMQWKNGQALTDHLAAQREHLSEELSDVLYWVLILAHDQSIDLANAFRRKLQINAEKYPVETAKGVARKYRDLT